MMKRKSMLGRRSRAIQQSPSAAALPSQLTVPVRNLATPKLPNREKTSPVPFQTPSINGSLSDTSRTAAWSVFKNCNVQGLKSPTNDDEGRSMTHGRTNVASRMGHCSRLNRFKQNDPLSELRNFGFPNILTNKNGISTAAGGSGFANFAKQPVFLPASSRELKLNKYHRQRKDVKGPSSVEGKENPVEDFKDESEDERITRELLRLQKKWEPQDIRTISPPWSNCPILSNSNLTTPQTTPSILVTSPPKSPKTVDFSTTLGVAPLESSLVVRDNAIEEDEQDTSFTELECVVNENTVANPQSLDLSTVLGTGSLGVHAVELLDKTHMTKTSWGTKFKSPLLTVTEEPESLPVNKENVPPYTTEDVCSPMTSNESDKVSSEVGLSNTFTPNLFKEFQDRLTELTSKIETAEEKRLQAETERRFFESERKKVFVKFFDFLGKNQRALSQPVSKRRKIATNSAKKPRPSVVASKLVKKEPRLHTPKNIGSYSRTPSQMSGAAEPKFVVFTPTSLRKNLSQQFMSIFGS